MNFFAACDGVSGGYAAASSNNILDDRGQRHTAVPRG